MESPTRTPERSTKMNGALGCARSGIHPADNYLRSVVSALLVAIWLVVWPSVVRAGPGDLDPAFGNAGAATVASRTDEVILAVGFVEQPNGKVVTVSVAPAQEVLLQRFLADGAPDHSFGTASVVTLATPGVYQAQILIQSTGRVVLHYEFQDPSSGGYSCQMRRFLDDGTWDATFHSSGYPCRLEKVSVAPDDSFLMSSFSSATGLVRKVGPDGTGGGFVGTVLLPNNSVGRFGRNHVLPDGKLLIAYNVYSGGTEGRVARYDASFNLDSSFGSSGVVTPPGGNLEDVIVYPDGRILTVAGTGSGATLTRYLPSGDLDTTFGTGGSVSALIRGYRLPGDSSPVFPSRLTLDAHERILHGGEYQDNTHNNAISRRLPSGELDPSFASGGRRVEPAPLTIAEIHVRDNGSVLALRSCTGGPGCPSLLLQLVGIACGDGLGDPGEQCDDGNTDNGDCCSSACEIESNTTVCREAAGVCDRPEFCNGASPHCPADLKQPASMQCNGGIEEPCALVAFCTGTGDGCPTGPWPFKPQGTECRAAQSVCDKAETCTGNSSHCPADEVDPAGKLCRPAAGVCDVDDFCDGIQPLCPTDQFASQKICRQRGDSCDPGEICDGSGPDCPTDEQLPDGTTCTPGSGSPGSGTCSAGMCIAPPGDVCGDGVVTGSEMCDDGNTFDGDGCSSLCTFESFSRQQISCVVNRNKEAGGLLVATLKDRYACAKDASRGRAELTECLALDRRRWIERAREKFLAADQASCLADPPHFGWAVAEGSAEATVLAADLLFDDLFASPEETEPTVGALLEYRAHRDASRCQLDTLLAVRKVAHAWAKGFTKRKKAGLQGKGVPILDAFELGQALAYAELDGGVVRAIEVLGKKMGKSCSESLASAEYGVADLFPGSCSDRVGSEDLKGCLETRIRCRICQAFGAVDDLDSDCDLFDDSLSNGSCG